jgi:hypothetical protein
MEPASCLACTAAKSKQHATAVWPDRCRSPCRWRAHRARRPGSHRMSNARLMFRGSIGLPFLVVSTSVCAPPQMHLCGHAALRACSWFRRAILSAVTPIGGNGSMSVLPSAFSWCLWVSGWPPTRWSCHSSGISALSSPAVGQASSSSGHIRPRASPSQAEDDYEHPQGIERVVTAGRFEELAGLVHRPRAAPLELLAGFGQLGQLGDVARDQFLVDSVVESSA